MNVCMDEPYSSALSPKSGGFNTTNILFLTFKRLCREVETVLKVCSVPQKIEDHIEIEDHREIFGAAGGSG